jgi:YHS domain-containing protein
MKAWIQLLLAGAVGLMPVAVSAKTASNASEGLTAGGQVLGLRGFDPVLLVTKQQTVRGVHRYTAVHAGVAYRFSSQKTRAAFEAKPERYVPQYGGFCAYGVSVGKKFDGDPSLARVRNGALYLFLNEDIVALYDKDPAGTLKNAERHWATIRFVPAEEL